MQTRERDLPHDDGARDCLERLGNGDETAREELFVLLHADLRRLASEYLGKERVDHTLQPTALVHEAWLRLVGDDGGEPSTRSRFLAVAATVMRHILVDHARSRRRVKRGGDWRRVPSDSAPEPSDVDLQADDDLSDVAEAIEALRERSVRLSQAVELHYFAGLGVDDIAPALDVSRATAVRDLRAARAFLKEYLSRNVDDRREPTRG